MASHLSISVELIAFMKSVLKNKKAALNSFLAQVLDDELRADITHVMHQPAELDGDELYSIVNTFLGYIEDQIMTRVEGQDPAELHSDEPAQLYHSLSPQTQVQLSQAFDNQALYEGVQRAANMLKEKAPTLSHSEQVKKRVLLSNLLDNWSPLADEEIN